MADLQRTVFVAGKDSREIAAISTETDTVIGRLDLGLVPLHMQVSESLAKLAAADGRAQGVAVAELASLKVRFLPLSFAPDRLLVSPDGLALAAIHDGSGKMALIDVLLVREKAAWAGPARIRDVMFTADGATLFVAADSVDGVASFDAVSGRPFPPVGTGAVTALARSPNGREGFARTADGIVHFDLKSREVLAQLPDKGSAALFPTGTGRFLMLPDPQAGTLTLAPVQPALQPSPPLKAASGIGVAYSAWFDTVAFLPSAGARKVLVYDLYRREADGGISIPGAPGPGVVTPDGGKLYLPIAETGEVVAIDARYRRKVAAIPVGFAPILAVMAGGYGICH